MPDPGLPGAIVLIVAVVIAVLTVWFVDRRGRAGKSRSRALHGMSRDESLSYFRDYGGSTSASGVREEDRTGRWGEADEKSR